MKRNQYQRVNIFNKGNKNINHPQEKVIFKVQTSLAKYKGKIKYFKIWALRQQSSLSTRQVEG